MAKNQFMQTLDGHLNTVFYNTDQFGIDFLYLAGGVSPGISLRGIFDSDPSNNPIDSSDGDFIDTRPMLRVREVDFETYSVAGKGFPNVQTDLFEINGVTYRCAEYLYTRTGETVCYMQEG